MTEAAPQMPDESLKPFGWLEGFYTNICIDCDTHHLAAKRSQRCKPCAEKAKAEYTRPHEDAPIADAGEASILAKITRKIGIAGNHLGLCIPVSHPPHTAHSEDVLKQYGAGVTYETWVAWKLVYEAYNELERLVAHTALANNSIPVWQPIETAPDGKQLDPDWYRTDSQKLEIWKEIAQERQELIESLWKEGHKLVPIDPTPEQLCAAEKAWQERMKTRAREGTLLSPPKDTHASFRETYKAMLAAAPQLREDR